MLKLSVSDFLGIWIVVTFGNSIRAETGCLDLGNITNGWRSPNVEATAYKWPTGTHINYACNLGYILKGKMTLTCQTNGTWIPSHLPKCIHVTCGSPQIEHGYVRNLQSKYSFGDRINLSCEPGYIPSTPQIECSSQGIWTTLDGSGEMPTCRKIQCSTTPLVPNARCNLVSGDTGYGRGGGKLEGQTAYCYCDQGYKLKDEKESSLVCVNGEWQGNMPRCLKRLEIVCSEPDQIANGYYTIYGAGGRSLRQRSGTPEGVKVSYICQTGFTLLGDETRTCKNGEWTGDMPSCVKFKQGCDKPRPIEHGDFNFYGDKSLESEQTVPENSTIFYFCHNGYKLNSANESVSIKCRGGHWSAPPPKCVKRTHCDVPSDIPNGNWIIVGSNPDASKYETGTKILYECERGYKAFGQHVISCDSSGYWSEYPPRCLPQGEYCSDPGQVPNGEYTCKPSHCGFFRVDVEVHYMCEQGFEPDGDIFQKCQKGGEWSGEKPKCRAIQTTPDASNIVEINSSTMTVVIATSCSVLGVLLVVMFIVAVQRKAKPLSRLCHPVPPPAPPYTTRPRSESVDEHDRVALIAFADGVQVVLPTYEESLRSSSNGHTGRHFSDSSHGSGRSSGMEYRPLPRIPSSLRGRPDSIRSAPPIRELPNRHESHRNSTVTINSTSTATRDNTSMSVSLPFGSMDTMNVSDGTSTSVTIETYDSGASNPSLALSQRAAAGSLGSSNGSLANEDAPLLEYSNGRENTENQRNPTICESTENTDDKPE